MYERRRLKMMVKMNISDKLGVNVGITKKFSTKLEAIQHIDTLYEIVSLIRNDYSCTECIYSETVSRFLYGKVKLYAVSLSNNMLRQHILVSIQDKKMLFAIIDANNMSKFSSVLTDNIQRFMYIIKVLKNTKAFMMLNLKYPTVMQIGSFHHTDGNIKMMSDYVHYSVLNQLNVINQIVRMPKLMTIRELKSVRDEFIQLFGNIENVIIK